VENVLAGNVGTLKTRVIMLKIQIWIIVRYGQIQPLVYIFKLQF